MPTLFAASSNTKNTNSKIKDNNTVSAEHLLLSHITIYRSGVILVAYLIVLELIFLFINLLIRFPLSFFVASVNANTLFTLGNTLYIGLTLVKIFFMLLIVTQWLENYYEIRPGKIIYKSGFFKRQEREFDCPDIAKITLSEDFWGRFLHFGTITIYAKINNDSFTLSNIPNPHRNLKLIQKAVNSKRVDITLTDELIEDE